MTNHTADLQLRKTARAAGLWYLIMAIIGAFCMLYIPNKIIVAGNAEATVNNILAHEMLFRFGILASIMSYIPFIITALYLYRLLKEVNLRYAQLMVALVLASVPILFVSVANNLAPLVLLSGSGYLSVFSTSQLHALVMFFLDLDKQCTFIAEIFWGLWLIPFGLLVFKSKFIPKIFGILLIINGISYLIDSFISLQFPAYIDIVRKFTTAPFIVGELSILLWLLIAGVRIKTE
jgi:hypothetical protein